MPPSRILEMESTRISQQFQVELVAWVLLWLTFESMALPQLHVDDASREDETPRREWGRVFLYPFLSAGLLVCLQVIGLGYDENTRWVMVGTCYRVEIMTTD